jgi:hypothetical protein
MHAWAEIEHKLAYKKEAHVPKLFKRKLYRISAKLEEADEQFEELRDAIINYKKDIVEQVETEKDVELNLDSLQAFLDFAFPNRPKRVEDTGELIDEFVKNSITLNDFIAAFEKVKKYLPSIEKEMAAAYGIENIRWAQSGFARHILDLTNDNYFKRWKSNDTGTAVLTKWRKKLNSPSSKK